MHTHTSVAIHRPCSERHGIDTSKVHHACRKRQPSRRSWMLRRLQRSSGSWSCSGRRRRPPQRGKRTSPRRRQSRLACWERTGPAPSSLSSCLADVQSCHVQQASSIRLHIWKYTAAKAAYMMSIHAGPSVSSQDLLGSVECTCALTSCTVPLMSRTQFPTWALLQR